MKLRGLLCYYLKENVIILFIFNVYVFNIFLWIKMVECKLIILNEKYWWLDEIFNIK